MSTIHDTREAWLTAAVKSLEKMLQDHGAEMPPTWAVSCGFPKNGFKRNPAIGECWDPDCSSDATTHIFVSPILEEPVQILQTTLHEMIHAAVGLDAGHKGEFKRVARAVGLKGRLTATYAEDGTELHQALLSLSAYLGPYPGKAMVLKHKPAKKGYFLVKLVSPNNPDYKFTIAPRLIEQYGMPKDYEGNEMEVAEE